MCCDAALRLQPGREPQCGRCVGLHSRRRGRVFDKREVLRERFDLCAQKSGNLVTTRVLFCLRPRPDRRARQGDRTGHAEREARLPGRASGAPSRRSDEQGLGRNILGDPLELQLGEQRRQPLSIASCNLGNGVEGGDVHLVERDARRLIWTHEVDNQCKDSAGQLGCASRNSDTSRQSSSRFRRARRSCRGRAGAVLAGLLLLHSKDLEWGPQGIGTKERVKSGG